MKHIRSALALLLALTMCLALVACGSEKDPADNKGGAIHLNVGMAGTSAVDTFDPASTTDDIGLSMVYDGLFEIDFTTGQLKGLLAEKWSYDDDCTLHVWLRKDAKFSNGDPITAEDVLFSFQRIATSGEKNQNKFSPINFDKSKIISDTELTIVTDQPNAALTSYMASGCGGIVCKSYVESVSYDEAFWNAPVCSGPFTVKEHVSGSYTYYETRSDYYGERPAYDSIKLTVYAEPATMMIDYETGAIDAALQLDTADAERILAEKPEGTTVGLAPAYKIETVIFSECCPYFDDPVVRQAMAYAIDTAALTEIGWGSMGKVSTGYLPEGLAYRVETGANEYNPEKAKELLAQAGYPDGFEIRVVTTKVPGIVRTAEALQAQLAKVGIKLDVQSYDLATAIPMWLNGEADISINAIQAQSLDPDEIWETTKASSTNQVVHITDETLNGYLNDGLRNPTGREEAYANVQNWLAENLRSIPVCDNYMAYCTRDGVVSVSERVGSVEKGRLRYLTVG